MTGKRTFPASITGNGSAPAGSVDRVIEILGHGSSSDRQLRVYSASRDIVEIADATEALPGEA